MNSTLFEKSIFNLISKTSTELPMDVKDAIQNAYKAEKDNSLTKSILKTIIENTNLAEKNDSPICQDTGFPCFYVKSPEDSIDKSEVEKSIKRAIELTTSKGILRANAVNPVTEKNSGNNLGKDWPQIYFETGNDFEIALILKGGGSENVSAQYALPDDKIKANRDLSGIKRAILDAVFQAQGKGCAPGFLGVCIGGDRALGFANAKKQFLRNVNDAHPENEIADLENDIVESANKLNIGPMGLGGTPTIFSCKIDYTFRHVASFYVTVSYMCWAFRRRVVSLNNEGKINKWLS